VVRGQGRARASTGPRNCRAPTASPAPTSPPNTRARDLLTDRYAEAFGLLTPNAA